MPKFTVLRNVMVLVSGTSLSQIVLVIASPVLTRIYSPSDFAILALFTALVQVLGVIAGGRYDLAMLIPKDDIEAYRLGVLSATIAALLSLILLIVAVLAGERLAAMWGLPELAPWLFMVPVAVLFGAVFASAQGFNLRLRAYKAIAGANIYKALIQAGVQIGLGLASYGAGGLVIGRTLSDVFANGRLIRSGLAAVGEGTSTGVRQLGELAKKYRRFPLFSAPAGLINVLNTNLMIFVLPIMLAPATLGFYALAMRVLGAPLAQVGGPIGQVFLREAAEEIKRSGAAKRSFIKFFLYLSVGSILFFGTLYFCVEWLFAFVFGAEWITAGYYAQILMPLFAARFVVSPLSGIATLTDNRVGLVINVVLLINSSIVLWHGASREWSAEMMLSVLSWSLTAVYLAYLPVIYRLACRTRHIHD